MCAQAALLCRCAELTRGALMILSSMARRRAKACGRSMVSVTALATVAVTSAQAQDSVSSTPSESTVSEVVVTGSRIIRNGYAAPTPVSVLGTDELNALNPVNVADAVNTLPAFSNSV